MGRSTDKVQSHDIIVAFFGVELHREAAGVASLIREFSSQGNSGESSEDWSLFSDFGQEIRFLQRVSRSTNRQTLILH